MKTRLTGVSGGIGSGKSVVSGVLRLRGFKVYDCDYRAKQLMEQSQELVRALKELCGENIYDSALHLRRDVLAERLFSEQELRAGVNQLVHAAVRNDIVELLAVMSNKGESTLFCESAILGVSGLAGMCDSIWWVDAPEEVRVARVMNRSKLTREQVEARMLSQQGDKLIVERSSVRVEYINNKGSDSLLSQINELIETRNR